MRISGRTIAIALIILILLIIVVAVLQSTLRGPSVKQPNSSSQTIPNVEVRGKSFSYKQIAQPLTPSEQLTIDKISKSLPFESADVDIAFSPEVNQFVVSENTPQGEAAFQQWLEDNGLTDLFAKRPEMFIKTGIPLFDFLDLLEKFHNEPESLPDGAKFDGSGKSGKAVSSEPTRDQLNNINLLTLLFEAINSTSPSATLTPEPRVEVEQPSRDLEGSNVASILPDPLPPISPKVFGDSRNYILNECTKNKSVYQQAEEVTKVPWQILLAIHYREASCLRNKSLISGRDIGVPEPDNGGKVYHSLLETAIAGANEFKGKIGGHSPKNFNELIAAAQRYHGTGGKNCGQVSVYKGPCPPPDGIDDPYPLNFFDNDHSLMYKVYCADHVLCSPPEVDRRHGIATIVRMLAE